MFLPTTPLNKMTPALPRANCMATDIGQYSSGPSRNKKVKVTTYANISVKTFQHRTLFQLQNYVQAIVRGADLRPHNET